MGEILLIFLLGICVGSFLNVLIDRLPREESPLKGRSYCESCKKTLVWYDLIPVLSFIFLGGKCRLCRFPISLYYPTVELITAGVFIFIYVFLFGDLGFKIYDLRFFIRLVYYLFLISSLIVIFFTDLKYGIIPDKIIYPSILASFLYLILNTNYLILFIASAFGSFLFFLLIFLITRGRGMGFGDVKLSFLLGLFLGYPKIIVAIYIAFLTGAIVSIILVLMKKKRFRGSTVPFGPFLVTGTLLAFFLRNEIIEGVLTFLSLGR